METDDQTFSNYRAEIARLLKRAAELTPVDQDRIRMAVRLRHDPDEARKMFPNGTPVQAVGYSALGALAAADGELLPDRVVELEALLEDGLAQV